MKILFLAEAVSLAHIGRPFVLASEAQKKGIKVHFACSADRLKKTKEKSHHFSTYPLYTIKSDLFYDRVNKGKFFYETNELKKYVEEERQLIKKINPDLIFSDFRLTAPISASLEKKPLLNLSNSYWSPFYSCPFPAPNFGIFKLLPESTSNFIFNKLRPIAFKTYGKELNNIRALFGLEKKEDFRELYTDGTYTAYMDMPDFVNLKNKPSNHFYLGPIIWSPDMGNERITLKEKNNVYISMGNTGDQNALLNILKTILKTGFHIILSGVSYIETMALCQKFPDLKNNSVIKPLIKAEEILEQCVLTICHGGSGTAYQSLSHGVPVLCFPKNPDQALVSIALTEKNLGRFLSPKNATITNMETILNDCLSNDILKSNALQYSQKIKQWDTLSHWNQFLSQFKSVRKSNRDIA